MHRVTTECWPHSDRVKWKYDDDDIDDDDGVDDDDYDANNKNNDNNNDDLTSLQGLHWLHWPTTQWPGQGSSQLSSVLGRTLNEYIIVISL